jgi:rubredoxin
MNIEDIPMEVECPSCHGPGAYMGVLGDMIHYRCRGCGTTFSTPMEVTEDED